MLQNMKLSCTIQSDLIGRKASASKEYKHISHLCMHFIMPLNIIGFQENDIIYTDHMIISVYSFSH